jgi:hypothetical protein
MNINLSQISEHYSQEQLAAFLTAIVDGENSGPMTDWDLDEVIQGAKQSIDC